ncbi:MAG: hypothetical protein Q8L23_16720 [Caulobacter sp.]|nr:hypothetical protein [Caulobacter sp.]
MQSARARAIGLTMATLVMIVLLAGAGEAGAAPARCRVGTYITSLSQVDTAAGTFRADFWMWSVCPTSDLEPLKTVEFVNAVSVQGSLDASLERVGGWWATRKFTGVFRQDFSLRNYPFDEQPLVIEIEEGVLDTRDFVYAADGDNSGMNPAIDLAGWRLKDFRLNDGVTAHPTTFGDPSLPRGISRYAGLTMQVGVERNHIANFIKATFPLYIAALLALISLTVTDGRMSLLGATTFAVVLSFVSVEKLVGAHDGVYLLDQLHFATLALIMAVTGRGVISLRIISQGGDAVLQRQRDLTGAAVLLAGYLILNMIMIGLAIANAKA